jgi:hypothetical protein
LADSFRSLLRSDDGLVEPIKCLLIEAGAIPGFAVRIRTLRRRKVHESFGALKCVVEPLCISRNRIAFCARHERWALDLARDVGYAILLSSANINAMLTLGLMTGQATAGANEYS